MKAKLVLISNKLLLYLYELSDPIFKGTSDLLNKVNIPESLNVIYNNLNPYYKTDAEKYSKGDNCYYVAIVMDYNRKHVFPAIKIRDNKYGFICDEIVGIQAKIMNGTVPVSLNECRPDKEYLQYLAILNNLCFEGIDDKTRNVVFDLDNNVLDFYR